MDRDTPESRAELEDNERWPYNDLQSLASAHGYGNPVGADRQRLVDHVVDELSLPDQPPDREIDKQIDRGEQVDRAENGNQSDSDEGQRDLEDPVDDGTSIEGPLEGGDTGDVEKTGGSDHSTDEIQVGHEGEEKLSPENAPESQGTALEPPGNLESGDIDPEDLEPTLTSSSSENADDSENQSEGGLRDRLLGGDESAEDVVEDADTEEERERREDVKQKLEDAMGASQEDVEESVQEGSADPSTTTAQGMVVDKEVVEHLIELPFNSASAATGWDGWELTAQERQANARLFVAMCDEHDVDVGPTVMFALSMAGTAGGRAVRYKRWKDEQSDGVQEDVDNVEESLDRGGRRRDRRAAPTPGSSESPTEQTADEDFGF